MKDDYEAMIPDHRERQALADRLDALAQAVRYGGTSELAEAVAALARAATWPELRALVAAQSVMVRPQRMVSRCEMTGEVA